ncbi:CLUMA_CG012376, isoform A [Clunio marinus]|uniref:CLUMA_CG012376, isoform A n=1 Tax=Clunio marinus TaxID=568069 RepID=A0A1J1IG35_9DIPT|nr:CLUMA_CG012376, isoform A [Clunio marinus]
MALQSHLKRSKMFFVLLGATLFKPQRSKINHFSLTSIEAKCRVDINECPGWIAFGISNLTDLVSTAGAGGELSSEDINFEPHTTNIRIERFMFICSILWLKFAEEFLDKIRAFVWIRNVLDNEGKHTKENCYDSRSDNNKTTKASILG